jgi:hypothetical protein
MDFLGVREVYGADRARQGGDLRLHSVADTRMLDDRRSQLGATMTNSTIARWRPVFIAALLLVAFPAAAQSWRTLPDSSLTPGLARTDISLDEICSTPWGQDARSVTAAMKRAVIASYNFNPKVCPFTKVKGKRVRRAEIDHLIPRDLGGADEIENLWPQCYEPVNKDKSKQADGANKKDRLEKELNKRLCAAPSFGLLMHYRHGMQTNWISLYHEIYPDE